MIVMGDLNAKVGLVNSYVAYVVGTHGAGVRNGTTFLYRTRDKVSWQHPSANQNDHLAISRRFRDCLEDIRNRKAGDIGNIRYHYLMVAMLRLRTEAIKHPNEMNRRAPTYFTRRLKSAATAALFNQSIDEDIPNFRSPY